MGQQVSTASPAIAWERSDDGVVTLVLDDPEQKVNTLNQRFTDSMTATVERLHDERDGIRGVVIRSAKPSFLAGGDLNRLAAIDAAGRDDFVADLGARKRNTRRLETMPFPVVAVLEGAALGGGLELALACHHRIAVDAPAVVVGLPEVTLGLLPGGGGVTRVTALLGAEAALPLLLEGRKLGPADALRAGLVDELATDHDDALARARAWIAAHPDARQPWDADAPAETDPARRRIRELVAQGAAQTFDERLLAESEALGDLVVSPAAKATIQVGFFDGVGLRQRHRPPRGAHVPALTLVPHDGTVVPEVLAKGAAQGDDGDGVTADLFGAEVPEHRDRPAVTVRTDAFGDLVAEVWPGGTTTDDVLAALSRAGAIPVLRAAGTTPLAAAARELAARAGTGSPLDRAAAGLAARPDLLAHPEDLDAVSVRAGGLPAWTGGARRHTTSTHREAP